MAQPGDLRELFARLQNERARLDEARRQYEIITSSRFHALRMLWFSLKHLIGKSSPYDVYAVWSKGTTVHLPPGRVNRPATGAAPVVPDHPLIAAWNQRVSEREMKQPIVTVVIPVYNQHDVTARCLQSISTSWFESLDVQFVIVDDGSTDGTPALITKLRGLDYVRNSHNDGFVDACNRGAMLAQGKYICFLNNDTEVHDGWLDRLVTTAEADASVGVVGAKLVFPNGRLQEAGGIIWRDATGWNVGRNENPDDPLYSFVRDVDYVSGAALLVRADVFRQVGGFSSEFRPAYYEDTDLCFKVRAAGYRVVYQPRAVVVHYEGATSGTDPGRGTKRFQEINRRKFHAKWTAGLEGHLENGRSNVLAAALGHKSRRTVLVIDSYVPMHDRESGSRRMFQIMKMMRSAGYNVAFLPDNFAPAQPYTEQLQQAGVHVLYHIDAGQTLHEALDDVLSTADVVWISRPQLYKKYAPLVSTRTGVRVIYDTVDLHFVRKRREAELLGQPDTEWRDWQRIELEAAQSADATVVVTEEEKQAMEDLGIREVFVVPNIHEAARVPIRRFEDTFGLLFVGSYNHPPNVDAARWLCDSVMPLVWKSLPDLRLTLAGSNPESGVSDLRSELIKVPGYVPDLASYFRKARLFVAPLRFGAGMKGKIGQALEYGVPVITTPIGAEGMGLRDGQNAVIREADAEQFASAIVSLYGDRECWNRIATEATKAVAKFAPEAVLPVLRASLS